MSSSPMTSSPISAAVATLWQRRRVQVWMAGVAFIVAGLMAQILWPQFRALPLLGSQLGPGVALAVFAAAMLCEYIDSSLGMGYGTTLVPLLLLAGFEPLQIVPAVLMSECLTGLIAGLLHHRDGNVDLLRDRAARSTAVLLTVLSVIGAGVAVFLAVRISKFWLTAIIAFIVLGVGILILLTARRRFRYRPAHIVLLGGVAAFNKALSGGGYGPLVTGGQVVSGISPKSAVAITSLAESFTCLIGFVMYIATRGDLYWPLAVPLIAGAVLSVPLATLTVRRLPERSIRTAVGVGACALGLLMFLKVSV